MESKFINVANRQGNNNGVYYFLGLFISFFIGQFIGLFVMVTILLLMGKLNMANISQIANPTALGISNNLSFFLFSFFFIPGFGHTC